MIGDSGISPPPGGATRGGRARLFGALVGVLYWLVVTFFGPELPHLAGTIAEVDGVFPLRAIEAWETAYAPGQGFHDKYPPLASWFAGGLLVLLEPDFVDAAQPYLGMYEAADRVNTVTLEPQHAAATRLIRMVSTVAMAWVVAVLAGCAASWAQRLGASRATAFGAAFIAAGAFGASNVVLYHALSTNVDALVLALSVTAVALLARETPRVFAAAICVGLAVATKDPAYVLGIVLFVAGWRSHGPLRALAATLVAFGVYAVASGMVVNFETWKLHVAYIVSSGVDTVPRFEPTSMTGWLQLARHIATTTAISIGHVVPLAGLAGLVLAVRAARRDGEAASTMRAWVVLLALLAPVVFFVLPIRFAFSRFLLLPYAMMTVMAAVAIARTAELAGWRGRLPACLALAAVVVLDGERTGAFDIAAGRVLHESPRNAAAAFTQGIIPEGSHVVVLAAAAHHPPPIDPIRWHVDPVGLEAMPFRLMRFRALPVDKRPEAVLIMDFSMDAPSGAAQPRPEPPPIGHHLEGMYEVMGVFGYPLGRAAERTLPVRPVVTVLKRLD